jgi:hypothetical protein
MYWRLFLILNIWTNSAKYLSNLNNLLILTFNSILWTMSNSYPVSITFENHKHFNNANLLHNVKLVLFSLSAQLNVRLTISETMLFLLTISDWCHVDNSKIIKKVYLILLQYQYHVVCATWTYVIKHNKTLITVLFSSWYILSE